MFVEDYILMKAQTFQNRAIHLWIVTLPFKRLGVVRLLLLLFFKMFLKDNIITI